jgi:D-serine deaminase-like pyridoxal phosphate-dependent protein
MAYVEARVDQLDTPAALIDYDVMLRNIQTMADRAAQGGVKIRPHTKTHKSPLIAHLQLKNGASGITVAKIGEAEVMAEAGIDDILVAYPIIGEVKASRLLNLRNWVPRLACTVDSVEGALGLSEAVRSSNVRSEEPLDVYIEVDVGLKRVGLPAGADVVRLAAAIKDLPGIKIRGILTHAGHAHSATNAEELLAIARTEAGLMVDTARMLREAGIPVEEVSIGSTPTSCVIDRLEGITEIRPGTYVFNDTDLVALGVATLADCALSVLATVVSRPADDRIVFDAGTKTLSGDKPGEPVIPGHGLVKGQPDIWIERLNEEHAMARIKPGVTAKWQLPTGAGAGAGVGVGAAAAATSSKLPSIGDKVEIVPNHACVVSNLFDRFFVVRDGLVVGEWRVQGRGKLA